MKILDRILAFSATRSRACAAQGVSPASKRTRSPAARSHPRRSTVAATRLAAVERMFASPCSPSHPSLFAGPSDYGIDNFLEG